MTGNAAQQHASAGMGGQQQQALPLAAQQNTSGNAAAAADPLLPPPPPPLAPSLHAARLPIHALARPSNLNENLGSISYLFTDKNRHTHV